MKRFFQARILSGFSPAILPQIPTEIYTGVCLKSLRVSLSEVFPKTTPGIPARNSLNCFPYDPRECPRCISVGIFLSTAPKVDLKVPSGIPGIREFRFLGILS